MATTYVKGSAILCHKPVFWHFLSHYSGQTISDEAAATAMLKTICGISSRRELATNQTARRKYTDLLWEFNHMSRLGKLR